MLLWRHDYFIKENKEVKCETTPLPIMQINEDNMTKYEFQITFGLGSDQIKLKFTISVQIHKTYYMCSNGQLSGFNKNSCPKPKYK